MEFSDVSSDTVFSYNETITPGNGNVIENFLSKKEHFSSLPKKELFSKKIGKKKFFAIFVSKLYSLTNKTLILPKPIWILFVLRMKNRNGKAKFNR